MIPAGIVHDPAAAVLMRGGRAARLCPVANAAIADLIAAGGEANSRALAPGYACGSTKSARLVHQELRRMGPALRRLSLAVEIAPDGFTRLADTGERGSEKA